MGGADGQNVPQVRYYIKIYIDICVFLGGHNLGTFYARKLK